MKPERFIRRSTRRCREALRSTSPETSWVEPRPYRIIGPDMFDGLHYPTAVLMTMTTTIVDP
jgi:hypothetical protein